MPGDDESIGALVSELRACTEAFKASAKANRHLADEVTRLREEFSKLSAAGAAAPPPPQTPRAPVDATAEVAANVAEVLVRRIAEHYQTKRKKG